MVHRILHGMVITSHTNVTTLSFTCTIVVEKALIPSNVVVKVLYFLNIHHTLNKSIYCYSTLVRLYNDILIHIVYASFSELGLHMNCCASAFYFMIFYNYNLTYLLPLLTPLKSDAVKIAKLGRLASSGLYVIEISNMCAQFNLKLTIAMKWCI